MSKRRKKPKGRHPGGGRVTPKSGHLRSVPTGDPVPSRHDAHAAADAAASSDPVVALASGLLEVESGGDPLPIDLWASQMIGMTNAALTPAYPWDPDPDEDWGPDGPPTPEEFHKSTVASFLTRLDGPHGDTVAAALHALVPYLPDEAHHMAVEGLLTHSATAQSAPPIWAPFVGTARVERCLLLTHETDDADQIALVVRYPVIDQTFVMMALIDLNMGGLAKDLLVTDDLEPVLDVGETQGIESVELDPAVAAARLVDALRITDMTIDAPVDEDLLLMRPLLERLMDTLPAPAELPDHEPPTGDELADLAHRLAERTLARADLNSDDDPAKELSFEALERTADLMLGYVATWIGRAPLTWSPARVELFLADFVPRKIAAPPDELVDLPERLAALVPAAHELAGWSDRYVAETLDRIRSVTPVFLSRISSPESGSPAKQMMMRALAEGVDLEDPDALDALVHRINAMGGVDVFGSGADLSYPLPEPIDTSVVAEPLRDRVAEIDDELMHVCVDLFDPEHLDMCRALLVRMANEHPDELRRGGAVGWGGGIPYALCQINQMFTQGWRSSLGVQGVDVVDVTGVSQQTLGQRAKLVRTLLDLDHWPPPEPYWRSDVRASVELMRARLDAFRHGRER